MSDVFGKAELEDLKAWYDENKENAAVKSAAPLIGSLLDCYERVIKNKNQQRLYLADLNKSLGFLKKSEKGEYAGKHLFGV